MDIVSAIFSFADVKVIVVCRRLSSSVREILSNELQNRFDVLLMPYTRDGKTADLRTLLRKTEGIITGSTALKYLMGGASWTPTDLDIAVPRGRSAVSLPSSSTKCP